MFNLVITEVQEDGPGRDRADRCMSNACGYNVPNELTNVDHILKALNNHILGAHPVISTKN